jgi:hypothetical protein
MDAKAASAPWSLCNTGQLPFICPFREFCPCASRVAGPQGAGVCNSRAKFLNHSRAPFPRAPFLAGCLTVWGRPVRLKSKKR